MAEGRGVTIELCVPFSDAAYEELKAAGYIREKIRGHDVYGIRLLEDLDHLLGRRWYLRILKPAMTSIYWCCGHSPLCFKEAKANCRTTIKKYRSSDGHHSGLHHPSSRMTHRNGWMT